MRYSWLLVWCAGLGVACSDSHNPRMELRRVRPSTVSARERTQASIEGSHFYNAVRVDLDSKSPCHIGRVWRATVPATVVVDRGLEYVDTAILRLELPPGLPLGKHDLVVTAPRGESATLLDAFTVVEHALAAGDPDEVRAVGGGPGLGGAGALGGEPGGAGDGGETSVAGAGGVAGTVELGPFGTPALATSLYDADSLDDDPSFTADLLELHFSSTRAGGQGLRDIWVSRRSSPSDPWGAPEVVAELNTPSHDTTPGVSADGLTLYFASDRPGGLGNYDIWLSTRASRQDPWSDPVHVPELSSDAWDASPQLVASGLQVVLDSMRLGGLGGADLYWSSRASATAPWEAPTPIPGVNSQAHDCEGRLMAGGQLLYLSSERNAANSRDLYLAEWNSTAGSFSEPQPIAELNTPAWDGDHWLSPDLRFVMFASNRGGSFDLYEAWR